MDKQILFLLLLISFNISVYANTPLQSYVGIDITKTHSKCAKELGDDIFKKKTILSNVYLGDRFAENLGIEHGFNTLHQIKRHLTILSDTTYLGTSEIFDAMHERRIKMHNFHLSAISFLPLSDKSGFLDVGVSQTTIKFMSYPFYDPNLGSLYLYQPNDPLFSTQYIRKVKYTPRISLGLQYLLTK